MHFVRESIFVSAVRIFCTAFAAILGITIAIGLIGIAIAFMTGPAILAPEKVEITIAPDANGERVLLPGTTPVILRINFTGVIGEGECSAKNIEKILLASHEDVLHGDRVKGILLYLNTPGGVAGDADAIYRMLLKYKKKYTIPIYAFVDGLCASGGMYVAAAADKVFATPESVVGSIGVIMGPAFNFSGAMAKYGIESLTLTEGKDKDMLNPFRPWKEGEDASLRNIMAQLYARFVDIMVENRPTIDKRKLINEYGAQVYLASDAEQIGYVDQGNSDYEHTVKALVEAAGISEGTAYQVFHLGTPSSFFSTLVDSKFNILKGKITHVFQTGPHLNSEMSGKFLYLYAPAG